jgi:hypothetical protein
MWTMERTAQWKQRTGMVLGAMALSVTYACGGGTAAQAVAADHSGAPVVVGCEAHQRTLVRQAVINGAVVSQVECVSAGQAEPAVAATPTAVAAPHLAAAYAPAPVAYTPSPVVYAPPVTQAPPPAVRSTPLPVHDEIGDARVVHTTAGPAPRRVQTRQVIYEDPPRTTRSPAKSAVIIGSSAGAGAGVGAVVGGKKGALIGAAIGGGGAAVWDQATRRK